MKKRKTIVNANLCAGELYLFHVVNPHCPPNSSLWGIYDKSLNQNVYLESSTTDLLHYRIWHTLPKHYIHCRRATRYELRDYMYNMGVSDGERK